MTKPATVFEDRETPGQWRVEWFDDDGRCELEIFSGPGAHRQALRYAMQRYGHFKEVSLSRIHHDSCHRRASRVGGRQESGAGPNDVRSVGVRLNV